MWVKLLTKTIDGKSLYGLIDDGVMHSICIEEHPKFVAWLEEGNTPEPWEMTNGDRLP